MKNHSKITAMFLCTAMLVNGCSAAGGNRDDGTGGREEQYPAITPAETAEETAPAPDAPANIKYVYLKDQKAIKFTWDAVSGASRYEVKNGTTTTIAKSNEALLDNVEEGDKGTIFIRSVGREGQVSEWSDADYFVEVSIDPPAMTYSATDGARTYIYWDPVDGATGYEVNFYYGADGKASTFNIPYPYTSFNCQLTEGVTKSFDIRSVKTVNNQNYYSDWAGYNYTDPTFKDLKDYNFYESCTLDYDRLKAWAGVNGYTLRSDKDGNDTIVEITFKDDVNSKLWARIKRAAGEMFNAAMESYEEGLFDLGNSVEAFRESKKKWKADFFDRLNAKAEEDAETNALVAGIKSAFTDVEVVCRYRFLNTKMAPAGCAVALDKRNRKTYADDFAAQHKPDSNGIYNFYVEGSEQKYNMMIDQNEHYWCIYLLPEHIENN